MAVHYFPALFVQPLVTADHLAPCSRSASINFSSSLSKPLAVALLPLLAILLLWRLFRIRRATWLLLPWMFFALTYLVLPRVEAEPGRPVLATAQVDRVDDITALGLSRRRGEYIPLGQPYEIVRLRFLPPGKDTPVTAVDKVDRGSVPNLQKGQIVEIVYDVGNPRIARLRQATRQFAQQARTQVLLVGVLLCLVVMLLLAVRSFFRRNLGLTTLTRA